MNNLYFKILVVSLLLTVNIHSQNVVTIIPDKPTLGDTITFIYHPNAKGAKLKNKKLITLALQPIPRPSVLSDFSTGRYYDMKYENGVWTKKLVFTDSTRTYFEYFFFSSTNIGDSSETDKRNEFQLLLYDQDGIPLPNALLSRAIFGFNVANIDSAHQAEVLEELKLHPTNFRAQNFLWLEQLTKSDNRIQTSAVIRRSVDSVLEYYPENLDALVGCANAYWELNDTINARTLESRIVTLFPMSHDAEVLKFRKTFRDSIPEKKIASLSELLLTFPNSERATKAFSTIEDYYWSKQDSTTPEKIKAEWEHLQSRDINEPYFSLDAVRKRLQENDAIEAPDFVLYDLNGNRITMKSLSGKIVVLDFWATWCQPCREALPHFQRLYEQYKSSEKVEFLAVDINTSGDSLKNVRTFVKENGYSFPTALDTTDVTDQFSITLIPTSVVIDSHGKIRFRTSGYLTPNEYDATINTAIETLVQR